MFLQYLSVNSVTGPRTKTKSQAEQDQEQQDGDGTSLLSYRFLVDPRGPHPNSRMSHR